MPSPTDLPAGRSDILIIVDHASNHVPADIDLGIAAELLDQHMAIDIGAGPLAGALAQRLACGVILGAVSRLVIDLNRETDSPGLIPLHSDGYDIPGNADLRPADRKARIDAWWHPHHDAIAARIAAGPVRLLIALHSFTPMLRMNGEPRPWEVGLLYNRDDRGARIAHPLLEARGLVVGDNLPYSGKVLNATMNRHAEAAGIPYLNFEVRQDLVDTPEGVVRWAGILAPVIAAAAEKLA